MSVDQQPPETPFDFLDWLKSMPEVDSVQFAAVQRLVDDIQSGKCCPEPPEHIKEHLRSLGLYPKEGQPSKLKIQESSLSKEEFEAMVKPMPPEYYKWLHGTPDGKPADEPSGSVIPATTVEEFEKNIQPLSQEYYDALEIARSEGQVSQEDEILFDIRKWLAQETGRVPEDPVASESFFRLMEACPDSSPLIASDEALTRFLTDSAKGDASKATPEAVALLRKNLYLRELRESEKVFSHALARVSRALSKLPPDQLEEK